MKTEDLVTMLATGADAVTPWAAVRRYAGAVGAGVLLAAGLMARQMGVPIEHFVAATTINDTVARYLETGAVEPRRSVPTLANAMDVGDPSNLERIRWMFGDDVRAIRSVVSTSVHTDEELKEAIVELDRRYAYVADPHTAIAYLGARPSGGVFLATAHPAKFGETVEATLGRPVETPAALVEAMGRPNLSKPIEPQLSELARYL